MCRVLLILDFLLPFLVTGFITDCKKSEKHPVQSASFNPYFYHCIFKTDGNSVCVFMKLAVKYINYFLTPIHRLSGSPVVSADETSERICRSNPDQYHFRNRGMCHYDFCYVQAVCIGYQYLCISGSEVHYHCNCPGNERRAGGIAAVTVMAVFITGILAL